MLDMNVTLWIQMANFLLLVFILNVVLYKPIRKILAERKARVDGLNEDIESAHERRDKTLSDFKAEIAKARKDGYEKLQGLKDEGHDREKEIVEAEQQEAEKRLQAVMATIEKDMEAARSQLSEQIKSFSVEVTEKILGRSI